MTISLRLNDEDAALFKSFADLNGISVSELVRQSVLSRIEDEYDLKAYDKAIKEYKKNPVTFTHEEVAQLLGLE